MKTLRLISGFTGLVLLAACAKEPPPVSVAEFMENPRLLEATMVRCGQNRSETKYLGDCVNAREAVNRLEAREKAARRAELEAQSERKRQALRRTQQAAARGRVIKRSRQRMRRPPWGAMRPASRFPRRNPRFPKNSSSRKCHLTVLVAATSNQSGKN